MQFSWISDQKSNEAKSNGYNLLSTERIFLDWRYRWRYVDHQVYACCLCRVSQVVVCFAPKYTFLLHNS